MIPLNTCAPAVPHSARVTPSTAPMCTDATEDEEDEQVLAQAQQNTALPTGLSIIMGAYGLYIKWHIHIAGTSHNTLS